MLNANHQLPATSYQFLLETIAMMNRPDRTEYADFYANYVSLVPEGSVEEFLLK